MVTVGGSILGLVIGKEYHYEALDGLFRASMTFFDTNPTGRILNRLNSDIVQTERGFPVIFGLSFNALMRVMASISIVCLSSPYMIVLVLLIGASGTVVASYFTPGKIELNRLVPIASSGVYSLLNDVLEGSSTIKAFQQMKPIAYSSFLKLDFAFGALFSNSRLTDWLRLRVVIGSSVVTLGIGIFSCSITKTAEAATTAGIALLSIISLSNSLQTCVYQLAVLESRVSRFLNIIFNL